MFTKENRKTIASLVIAGFIIGAILSHNIATKPLENTILQQSNKINQLEINMTNLEEKYEEIELNFSQLKNNTIDLTNYEILVQEKTELENEINLLSLQLTNLETIIEANSETISSLEKELNQIQSEYDTLLIKYEKAYNPLYVEFTIDNLAINITVMEDSYPSNSDIAGTVSIIYTNGQRFSGTFTLLLKKVYLNAGVSSDVYLINGEREYLWSTPFALGPGSYKIMINDIKLPNGETVVSNTMLRDHAINLFVG